MSTILTVDRTNIRHARSSPTEGSSSDAQADPNSQLAGLEGVIATQIGTFGGNLSVSRIDNFDSGFGGLATFQRLIQRSGGRTDSVNLSFEFRSRDFGAMGTIIPFNPFRWEVGGGYSHAFNDAIYAAVDGRYSKGRGDQRNIRNLRGTVGWRINPTLNFTVDSRWERDTFGSRVSALLSLTTFPGGSPTDSQQSLRYQVTFVGQSRGPVNATAITMNCGRAGVPLASGQYLPIIAKLLEGGKTRTPAPHYKGHANGDAYATAGAIDSSVLPVTLRAERSGM